MLRLKRFDNMPSDSDEASCLLPDENLLSLNTELNSDASQLSTTLSTNTTDDDDCKLLDLSSPDTSEQSLSQASYKRGRLAWRTAFSLILTFLAIAGGVTSSVLQPLYVRSMVTAGSDITNLLIFALTWAAILSHIAAIFYRFVCGGKLILLPLSSIKICAFIGLMNAISGVLVIFASDPSRTPPYQQAILGSFNIPVIVLLRYLILRKGISILRCFCVAGVLVGGFIAAEPQIFKFDSDPNDADYQKHSLSWRVIWPLVFIVGGLPIAIQNVLLEKETHSKQHSALVLLAWYCTFTVLFQYCLFWTDFIPVYGMASSFDDFKQRFLRSLTCHFGLDASCNDVAIRGWIMIIVYLLSNWNSFLLIRYSEGAIYLTLAGSLTMPLSAIFWALFNFDPFFWRPTFTATTAFTLAGLVVMAPSVFLYNWFSTAVNVDSQNTRRG